jgi:hypothetical protein
MVGDVVMFEEGKNSAALFVGGLGDIEYGSRGAVCEMCEGGCLVGEVVE